MHRFLWLLPACLGLVSLQAQRKARFPPEMQLERFIDVAKVAPRQVTVDLDNTEVRVLHTRLSGRGQVPFHDDRSGVIVALTDLQLRLTTPDKKFRDLHLKTGESHWIDGDAFFEENLSGSACEFLFVETKKPTGPIPYTPPA